MKATKEDKKEALNLINKAYLDEQIDSTELKLRVSQVNKINNIAALNKIIADINDLNFKDTKIKNKKTIFSFSILTLIITLLVCGFIFKNNTDVSANQLSYEQYLSDTYNNLISNINEAQNKYHQENNAYSNDIYKLANLDKELELLLNEITDNTERPKIEIISDKNKYSVYSDIEQYGDNPGSGYLNNWYSLEAEYKVFKNKTTKDSCVIISELPLGTSKNPCKNFIK